MATKWQPEENGNKITPEENGNKITPEENGNSNKNSIRASSNREKHPQRLLPRSPAEEQRVETAMKYFEIINTLKYKIQSKIVK